MKLLVKLMNYHVMSKKEPNDKTKVFDMHFKRVYELFNTTQSTELVSSAFKELVLMNPVQA